MGAGRHPGAGSAARAVVPSQVQHSGSSPARNDEHENAKDNRHRLSPPRRLALRRWLLIRRATPELIGLDWRAVVASPVAGPVAALAIATLLVAAGLAVSTGGVFGCCRPR